MNAQQKLNARVAALTTEELIEVSMRMVVVSSCEATVVVAAAEKELERRMSAEEFTKFMSVLDAMLDEVA